MRHLAIVGVVLMSMTSAHAEVLAAVEQGDIAKLTQAITASDAIDERNSEGQTALLVATWKNNIAAAEQLIAAGADVNAKDNISDSPYLVAGAHGRTEILKLVLANGADLKSVNRFGGTALIPAAEKGHPEAVRMLVAAGVDLDHINRLGWTALMEAVVLTNGGPIFVEIVKTLLEAGADPNIADNDGVSALTHAKSRNFTEMVTLLETHGGM
jgi:ankyrin repeat protein